MGFDTEFTVRVGELPAVRRLVTYMNVMGQPVITHEGSSAVRVRTPCSLAHSLNMTLRPSHGDSQLSPDMDSS